MPATVVEAYHLFIPVGEQRRGEIEAFVVSALRHHIDLGTDALFIHRRRMERIAN